MAGPSEFAAQRQLFKWAKENAYQYPELVFLTFVPLGTFLTVGQAVKLKNLGVKPYFPDLILPIPRGGYHGLLLEGKRLSGGHIEPGQKIWHELLTHMGYAVKVPRGAQAMIDATETYVNLEQGINTRAIIRMYADDLAALTRKVEKDSPHDDLF